MAKLVIENIRLSLLLPMFLLLLFSYLPGLFVVVIVDFHHLYTHNISKFIKRKKLRW